MNAPAFTFSSSLPAAQRPALDELFYFNPRQQQFHQGILESISLYGKPTVIQTAARITMGLELFAEAQTIFAIAQSDPKPVGVAIWLRQPAEHLVVAHMAVHPDYTNTGQHAAAMLPVLLFNELRHIARHLRGVTSILNLYAPAPTRQIPL